MTFIFQRKCLQFLRMSEWNVNHLLWFRLLWTDEGVSVKQTIEQDSTSGSYRISGSGLLTHLAIGFIIEITI